MRRTTKRLGVGLALTSGLLYAGHREDVVSFEKPQDIVSISHSVHVNKKALGHVVTKGQVEFGKLKNSAFGSKHSSVNTAPNSNSAGTAKKLASLSAINKAVEKIKTMPSPVCPQQPGEQFILTSSASSMLCLKTDNMLVTADGKVAMEMALNSQSLISVPAVLNQATAKPLCPELISRLDNFGQLLFQMDGGIATYEQVPIVLAASFTSPSQCDTYQPPNKFSDANGKVQ